MDTPTLLAHADTRRDIGYEPKELLAFWIAMRDITPLPQGSRCWNPPRPDSQRS